MNKKNILILAGTLLILFVVGLVIAYYITNSKIKIGEISKDRLKELFDNSYKYSLLFDGDTCGKDAEEGFYVEGDDNVYCLVPDFNDFNDIKKIIDSTFVNSKRDIIYSNLLNHRKFVENDNKLYVGYEKVCSNIPINFDDVNVSYKSNGIAIIGTINIKVYAYYEDGEWYLDGPIHQCTEESNEE